MCHTLHRLQNNVLPLYIVEAVSRLHLDQGKTSKDIMKEIFIGYELAHMERGDSMVQLPPGSGHVWHLTHLDY